jgi:dihydropteroate synthase
VSHSSHHESTPGGQTAPFVAPPWDVGQHVLTPPGRPLVMGVLNLTPDSFHPDSRAGDIESAVAKGMAMVNAGADILDLGAASSRPGAESVTAQEEADRLLPVLSALAKATDTPLSVDTFRTGVARQALGISPCVINDITGGQDPGMFELVALQECGIVLMHRQGDPKSMQQSPQYQDPVREIAEWLSSRAGLAEEAGINPNRILVDPGIGFGKTRAHNLALLQRLKEATAGRPHLLGVSRKRFIGEITGAETADRLPGSLAALTCAWQAGASVVRVHDVAETVQYLEVMSAIAMNGTETE